MITLIQNKRMSFFNSILFIWSLGLILSGCSVKKPSPSVPPPPENSQSRIETHRKEVEFVQIPGKAYSMSKTEITVGQYRQCVDAGVCNSSELTKYDSCNWGKSGRDDHPITCVDWNQARQFAQWVNGYLPTSKQWEFAAKGGEGYQYAGSNTLDEVGWYKKNSGGSTHPVGQKKSNGYGLYDMSGNVWEWTVTGSSKRVFRGGGWYDVPSIARIDFRYRTFPSYRNNNLGFRVVKFK